MKIVEQTPNELKLEDRNRQWLWGVLFGTPFVAIGSLIITLVSTVTTLTCQRIELTKTTCQRITSGILGTAIAPIPGQVSGASVIVASGVGVVLKTTNGAVELVNHRIWVGEKHYQIANQINALANDSKQNTWQVSLDDRWEGLLWGANFLLPGIAIMLASLAIPMEVGCIFDKTSDLMTLEKRYRLFGTRFTQHRLAEIQKVEVIQLPISNKNPLYVVRLNLTSNKKMALSPFSSDRDRYQTIVTEIERFLK